MGAQVKVTNSGPCTSAPIACDWRGIIGINILCLFQVQSLRALFAFLCEPLPLTSALNKDFGRIQWNRLEPIGSAPCNHIIASGFGAAGIKAVFYSFRPPRHSIPRLWRAWRPRPPGAASPTSLRGLSPLAWRDVPVPGPVPASFHFFLLHYRPPRPPRTVKTINSSRWRGLERESEHRLEPMEGVDFFQKSLRSLRSRIQIIGSNRYAGPNRALPLTRIAQDWACVPAVSLCRCACPSP